jgi:hypothetical protein
MVNRKSTTQAAYAEGSEQSEGKSVKNPGGRKKQTQVPQGEARRVARKDTPEPHDAPVPAGEAGNGEERLRNDLRACGVAAAQVRPLAQAVMRLVELSQNNRTGFQSALAYIGSQPSCALPPEPPEYFRNRPIDPETGKRETIVKFLERVWYDPWIRERLLTRTALRKLDLPAATALNNFLHAPKERWESKNELPEHLVVPTKSEVNDALLQDAERVREARRIVDARWRRQRGLVRGKK